MNALVVLMVSSPTLPPPPRSLLPQERRGQGLCGGTQSRYLLDPLHFSVALPTDRPGHYLVNLGNPYATSAAGALRHYVYSVSAETLAPVDTAQLGGDRLRVRRPAASDRPDRGSHQDSRVGTCRPVAEAAPCKQALVRQLRDSKNRGTGNLRSRWEAPGALQKELSRRVEIRKPPSGPYGGQFPLPEHGDFPTIQSPGKPALRLEGS
jgi:hypothetical protein